MKLTNSILDLLSPSRQLLLSVAVSLITALLAFDRGEMEQQTVYTFVAFYLILFLMVLSFQYRHTIKDPRTAQLLQFSYILLGFVLMLTGVISLFNGNWVMISVFILMLFLPGLALMRCGLGFISKKDSDNHV